MTHVKIGFVLLSHSQHPMPSTRIMGLNMFPFLRQAGFEPHIVFEPERDTETPDVSGLESRLLTEGFHIVLFQKVFGKSVVKLTRRLSAAGIKTVYNVCDLVNIEMAMATDVTIVVTDYLKSLYPNEIHSKLRVVHDGIEHPEFFKNNWGADRISNKRPLRAVLVTSSDLDYLPVIEDPPEWLDVSIVGRYPPTDRLIQRLRIMRWKFIDKRHIQDRLTYLRFLACGRISCYAWDPVGVYQKMLQADIGIIPINTLPEHKPCVSPPSWKVKSENRLTMKMCVGLPVIATPIPSYEPIIEHGRNGFLARSRQEWIEYLNVLRDPTLRKSIGEQARESVLRRYSMQEQARLLVGILQELIS